MDSSVNETLRSVLQWHWSPDQPAEYAINYEGDMFGIGALAGYHPGAFNLAWALAGSLSAKDYRRTVMAERCAHQSISWVVPAAHANICVYTVNDRHEKVMWYPMEQAYRLSLGEFIADFSEERRAVMLNIVGIDCYPPLLEAYRKRLN